MSTYRNYTKKKMRPNNNYTDRKKPRDSLTRGMMETIPIYKNIFFK